MARTAPALLLLLVFAWVACSSKSEPEPAANAATVAASSATATPADIAQIEATLAELTQAVRKYGMEQQKVPKDLNELVSAGYLPAVPAAPEGKRFAIGKRMEVYLADR